MAGFIIKENLSPRLFFGLLAIFFLSIPLQSTAQVIIREKLELSDTTKSSSSKVKAQTQNYRDAWFLQWGGSYSLTLKYLDQYDQYDYQLYEEGLGLLTSDPDEGQTIKLGKFPQWHSFKFYLQHPESGKRVDIEPFERYGVRVDLWSSQKDSTLSQIPPAAALNYHGNPFEASGEVTIQENGYMRLDMRGGSVGEKDLYIDMPKDSLIKENIKEVHIEHVDVRTVRKGEVYRFYIKSEFPIVSGRKLYPEIGYGNSLRFEDRTDLTFQDLTVYVEVVDHPKTPRYIRLRSRPSEVLPDYDQKTFFRLERINEDYTAENFPEDQTFNIQMDESKAQYATLHDPATNQKGTSLDNVTANFHMDIKSHEEIGDFTGFIEVKATTKVPDPVSEELIEISGDWDTEVVNKKMFLEFNPNPVAKGDTALIQRRLLYVNGVEKQLPLDQRIPYASIHPDSRSFGSLRNIATGETGNYLYDVTEGLQFVSRDDIAQDKVEARMVASSYVEKEMPSSGDLALSSRTLSESKSSFDNLTTKEKKIIDQRYWERVESGGVDTASSDTPKLMENSDIGMMTHNSDQDYIDGSGSLIITDRCEEGIEHCTIGDKKPQKLSENSFEAYSEKEIFSGKSVGSEEIFTTEVKGCSYQQPTDKFGYKAQRLGVTFALRSIPIERNSGEPYYVPFSDMGIKSCLLESEKKWLFNLDNIRLPLFSSYCPQNEYQNLGDGTNYDILANNITSYEDYLTVLEDIEYWKKGPYSQLGETPNKYIFKAGIEAHEGYHLNNLKKRLRTNLNEAFKEVRKLHYEKKEYSCPAEATQSAEFKIHRILTGAYNSATSKQLNQKEMKQNERSADDYSSDRYEKILINIQDWAKTQPWFQ